MTHRLMYYDGKRPQAQVSELAVNTTNGTLETGNVYVTSNINIDDTINYTTNVVIRGETISIGNSAGASNQKIETVAIGQYAGESTQSSGAVAIGYGAGQSTQQPLAIAIGQFAGKSNQGKESFALGYNAGALGQGEYCFALGTDSGNNLQQEGAIAIGYKSGNYSQGDKAIAIGYESGISNQGTSSIAIGYRSNALNNSIVLNASGIILHPSSSNGFFVKPIKTDSSKTNNTLTYDTSTGEIFNSTGGVSGGAAGQVAYYSDAVTVKGEAGFTYDETDNELTVSNILTTVLTFTGDVTEPVTGVNLQLVTDAGNTTTNQIMIGSTSSPSANLHVVGNVYSTGNLHTAGNFLVTGGMSILEPAQQSIQMGYYTGSPNDMGIEISSGSSGDCYIDFSDISDTSNANFRNRIISTGGQLNFHGAGESAGNTPTMTLNEFNVGIGTSSPSANLHVTGSTIQQAGDSSDGFKQTFIMKGSMAVSTTKTWTFTRAGGGGASVCMIQVKQGGYGYSDDADFGYRIYRGFVDDNEMIAGIVESSGTGAFINTSTSTFTRVSGTEWKLELTTGPLYGGYTYIQEVELIGFNNFVVT